MAISSRALEGVDAPADRNAPPSATITQLDALTRQRHTEHGRRSTRPPSQSNETFEELSIHVDTAEGCIWCGFNHNRRPCFTPELLDDITRFQSWLKQTVWTRAGAAAGGRPIETLVWHSTMPTMWNLGGDLSLFVELIRRQAETELRHYAYACVDTVYQNWTKLDLPLLTIALVQGDALGGGFEAVLTNDVVIAERQSKFGLPEILFNMFPGMGAYSLLCRRLDGARAERMITSGRLYEAEELEAMGLVDVVAEPGEGVAAVREYLARNQRRLGVLGALSQVRRRCQPVSYDELIDVTDLWVDTALGLDEADLKRMERLAAAQQRRFARAGPAAHA